MSMPRFAFVVLMLLAFVPSSAAVPQFSTSMTPETVVVSSGALRLTGLLWKPEGPGPFPAILFSHGLGETGSAHAQSIGPVFARHGYVFLFLFRRGEGLSAAQGAFMGDLLDREATARGAEARTRLQLLLMTTDHLDDVTAGLSFLTSLARVDSGRIAVAGHSFGGQLTLLVAERDRTVRAAVTFAAAAQAWEGSAELRERLLAAVRNIRVPVLFMHAANDVSTVAGQAMAAEMERLDAPHELKIYPPVGDRPGAGHGAVYTDIATWEGDVFRFLDEHVRRRGR